METTNLYPLLFDAIKDPLILVDQHGGVLMANASALSCIDFGPSHAVRTMVFTEPDCVFEPREVAELMKRFDSVREYGLKDANGRESGVSLDIESVHDPGGAGNLKLLHFRNRSAARQRELWRDEIISLVSHEIKNPLSAMKNSVNILLSQLPGGLTEGQKQFLQTSGRSIDRLTHLLDGFLDVSRINSGAFELKQTEVDMRQFAGDVIRSFKTLFNVKRANLEYRVAPEVNVGFVDSGKLEQVIINLLSNALKFTPENGNITLSVGLAGVAELGDDLRLLPWDKLGEPHLLEIVVEDNGLGMSSETLENLFNRYHKTNGLDDGRGAHLGLNISKKLLEAQNGWFHVASRLGIGTRVSAYVPQNRNTSCVLSRMTSLNRILQRTLSAHHRLRLYALGKCDNEDWEDIRKSWRNAPLVNPAAGAIALDTFFLWTINTGLALAALVEGSEAVTVADVFGPSFVQKDESTYMFKGYTVGECRAPGEASTLAQLCNVAMNRMDTAREELIRSMTRLAASAIESVVVDLGS